MKSFVRGVCQLMKAVSFLTVAGASLAGASSQASTLVSAPPAVPFDARVSSDTSLFRKTKPEEGDAVPFPAWHVLTVFKIEPERTWQGETAPMVAVHRHAQSTNYTLLSRLQPLAPGEVLSDEQAGVLLFQKVPEAHRSWCQRFTERVLLPGAAEAGKADMLIYSGSSDDACAGYMMLVSGTGKAAKTRALPRRGVIESISVHALPSGPPLLDLLEAVRGPDHSGSRRTLLSVERSSLREVLAVDAELHQQGKDDRHSVVHAVALNPSGDGLDIEVRRTETRVALATDTEREHSESVKRYHYARGKLKALPDTATPGESIAPALPKH